MATITDVASRAGVVPSVVSRLLNDDPTLRIRDETRRRILAAASELHYVPHHAARALRRARTGVLGFAVHDLDNAVYNEVLVGAQEEAQARGYVLVMANVDTLANEDQVFRQVVRAGAIDGLILQRNGRTSDRVVSEVVEAAAPVVCLNERVRAPLAGVAVDDRSGARIATEHLIELGHRRIGYLDLGGRNSRARDRRTGWEDALTAARLPAGPDQLCALGGTRPATGRSGMATLLARRRPPTAVLAGSLLAAVGALTAVRDAGLTAPDDVSLVGFHDAWYAEHVWPSLTVVRLPLAEMGRQAVRLLTDRIAGEPARRVVITDPPPVVVQRGSSAPPN